MLYSNHVYLFASQHAPPTSFPKHHARTYPLGFGLRYLSFFESLKTCGNRTKKSYKAWFLHLLILTLVPWSRLERNRLSEAPCLREPAEVDGHFLTLLDWSDLWQDAKMEDVIQYLRTSKYCTVPNDLYEYIPWGMFQPF